MKLDKQKNAMLWEISGNGLSHKSYLFGTMHGGGHNFTQEEFFMAFPQLREILVNVSCIYLEQSKNFNDSAVVADCMASASVFQKQMKQANIIHCLKVKAIKLYMIVKRCFGL